ncbi:MAG: PDDEXK nuclease domain-containing protein [Cyanobacteria bacterium P01_F01_bin.53]
MSSQPPLLPPDAYDRFLSDLKILIKTSQVKAALAVNSELILLYWKIGRDILQRQQQEGWGSKVIERLSKDLKRSFPDIKGFSRTNLMYMRALAEAWPDEQFVHQLGGQIPWKHNCIILDKVKDPNERRWYIHKTIENGWSRNILALQIDTRLYHRQGSAVTNFEKTLPKPQSELAQELIKDPYNFDFLTLGQDALERELERGLLEHIRDFLLELGLGFAFLGSQYPVVVDDIEYRMDLLFYHTRLHCYIVIDLKMKEFAPEFSGKMNFYVSAVDHYLRTDSDNQTIGIILCRSKRKTTVEFALQDLQRPIGVSTYHLSDELPETVKSSLPTIEQLEMELETAFQEIEAQSTQAPNQSEG